MNSGLSLHALAEESFQENTLWDLVIVTPPPLDISIALSSPQDALSTGKKYLDTGRNLADSVRLSYLVQDATLPFVQLSTETNVASGEKYYKSIGVLDPFSVTFLETEGHVVSNYFDRWESEIYDKDSRTFKKGPTKRSIMITFYGKSQWSGVAKGVEKFTPFRGNPEFRNNQTTESFIANVTEKYPTAVYLLEGVSFLGLEPISLSYSSADAKRVVAKFDADKVTKLPWVYPGL